MLRFLGKITNVTTIGAATLALGFTMLANSNHAFAQALTLTTLNAYSCSDATYGTSGSYFSGVTSGGATYTSRSNYTTSCETGNTSNASGAVVTATQTLRAATAQTVGLISSRISAVRSASLNSKGLTMTALSLSNDLSNGQVGLAGGNASKGIGMWLQGQYTSVDYDPTAVAFDGNIITGMFGIDKKLTGGKIILGIAGGYEGMDIDTTFNSGTVKSDGFIVTPYLSMLLGKNFSIDATAGYASLDYDTTRTDPSNGEIFSGTTDADRYFGSAILRFDKRRKKSKGTLRYGVLAGASYTNESKDAYTETGSGGTNTAAVGSQRTHLGQGLLGVNAGFDFGKIEPFINLTGEFDFAKTNDVTVGASQVQATDADIGLRVGGGLNFRFSPKVTGLISGDAVVLREDYLSYSGTARIRVDF
jgi:hypothetical protein